MKAFSDYSEHCGLVRQFWHLIWMLDVGELPESQVGKVSVGPTGEIKLNFDTGVAEDPEGQTGESCGNSTARKPFAQ